MPLFKTNLELAQIGLSFGDIAGDFIRLVCWVLWSVLLFLALVTLGIGLSLIPRTSGKVISVIGAVAIAGLFLVAYIYSAVRLGILGLS